MLKTIPALFIWA